MDDQRSGKRSREEEDEQANNKRQKTHSEGSYQLAEIDELVRLIQEQGDFPPSVVTNIFMRDAIDKNDNGNGGNDNGDNNTNRSSANNNHNNNNGQKDVHSSTDERMVGVSSGKLQIYHVQASEVPGPVKPEEKTSTILEKAYLIQDGIRAVRDGRHYFYAHSPTVKAEIGDKIGHVHSWVTETHSFFYLTLNTRVQFDMIFKDGSRTSIVHFYGTGASPATVAARNKARMLRSTSLSLGAPQAAPQATKQNTVAPAMNLGASQNVAKKNVAVLVIAPQQVVAAVSTLLSKELSHHHTSRDGVQLFWDSRGLKHWCVALAPDTLSMVTINQLCESAFEIVLFACLDHDEPITYVRQLKANTDSLLEFMDKVYRFPKQQEIQLKELQENAQKIILAMVRQKYKTQEKSINGLFLVSKNCDEKDLIKAANDWALMPYADVPYDLCFCAQFNASPGTNPTEAVAQVNQMEPNFNVESVASGRGSIIVFFTAPPSFLWLARQSNFEYYAEKFHKHGLVLTSLAPATRRHLAHVIKNNANEPFRDELFDLYCQLEAEDKIISRTDLCHNAALTIQHTFEYTRRAHRVDRSDTSAEKMQAEPDISIILKPRVSAERQQTSKTESMNNLDEFQPLRVTTNSVAERRSRNLLLVLPSAESSSLFSLLNGTVMTINPDFSVIRYEADESLYCFPQPDAIDMVFICQNKDDQALTRLAKGADITVIIKCADSAEYVSLAQVEDMSLQKEAPFGFALQSSNTNLSETDLNIARMFRGSLSAFWITPRNPTMEGIIESALYTLIHSLPHVKHRPAFMVFTFNLPVRTEDEAHAIVDQQFKALNLPCWFKVVNFIKERVVISTTSWLVSLFVELTATRLQDEGLMSVPQSVLADGRKYLLSAVLPIDEANISEALDIKAGERTTNLNLSLEE